MATFNPRELFVVASWGAYVCTSMCGDTIYTEKDKADDEADRLTKSHSGIKYMTMTLDEYMDEMRSEAVAKGQNQSRN